jgi:hypothetical protein
MDDLNQEREAFASVDHALHTLPIASPPPSLTRNIMANIRAQAQPRFRLRWFDYLASAIGASAATALLFFIQSIPLQVIFNAEFESARFVNQHLWDFIGFLR